MNNTSLIVYNEKVKIFKSIKYVLVYFNSTITTTDDTYNDIIFEWQYSKRRFFSKPFYTLSIDLMEDKDIIFSRFEKNTKYQIKRAAEKDNLEIKTLNARNERYLFYEFYNLFAATKNKRSIDINKTNMLIDQDMFSIRAVMQGDIILVMHSYILANGRARLAHSASLFREAQDQSFKNLIGRANRLLHWHDILYFQELNYSIYDLGGIDKDTSNKETQAINRFKQCFGGTLVKEYKSYVPVSLKGIIYLVFKKITGKLEIS